MAELLISAADNFHHDPAVDARLIKKGDLVTAMPDGHQWGREELNPDKFLIVRVPDLPLAEARSLCVPDFEAKPGKMPDAPGPAIRRARRFMIDIPRLAPELRERLRQAQKVGKPLEAARSEILGPALIDKKTRQDGNRSRQNSGPRLRQRG